MNKINRKKVIILFAIAYLGYGVIFTYSGINTQKSIFICDPVSNIDEGSIINSQDAFFHENVELGKCKQRSWGREDITSFIIGPILWLPLILLHR